MALYNLINCIDETDQSLIDWQGTGFLDEAKSYIFTSTPDVCYRVVLRFETGTFPIYGDSDILTEYADCETCNAICYRLVDCSGGAEVLTSDDLAGYIGKTIKWQNDSAEEFCADVTSFICRTETFTSENITVIDCYDTCTECTAVPVVETPSTFKATKRAPKPNYELGICKPEEYDKANCKFSELVFHDVASRRYGIEHCCDDDLDKWDVKQALMNLQVIQSRFDKNNFEDLDPNCEGVGVGIMSVNNDDCVVWRVVPIDEPLIE
jgi:hypothetical protein